MAEDVVEATFFAVVNKILDSPEKALQNIIDKIKQIKSNTKMAV